jgi:hypothetical protein
MTHRCARRVGIGCVAHRAAEAAAFDLPGSSAIDEPHSGQKCLRIGLPLPPMLLNVLSAPLDRHRLLGHSNQRGKGAAGD